MKAPDEGVDTEVDLLRSRSQNTAIGLAEQNGSWKILRALS